LFVCLSIGWFVRLVCLFGLFVCSFFSSSHKGPPVFLGALIAFECDPFAGKGPSSTKSFFINDRFRANSNGSVPMKPFQLFDAPTQLQVQNVFGSPLFQAVAVGDRFLVILQHSRIIFAGWHLLCCIWGGKKT